MGAWGVEPWDNDTAADWFGELFESLDVDKIQRAIEDEEDYDTIRAACFVLATLGRVYVWPADRLDELKTLLDTGIEHLTSMVEPSQKNLDFLEQWENNPEVVESINRQIEELKARRAGIL